MDLVQKVFKEGILEEEVACKTAVLIPKGNVYFQGIVLVKVLWKKVTVIFNHRLGTAISFQGVLHS